MESSKTSSFDIPSPMLIIFGGLPATGKTTIAKELARQIGATYLRIDTIEQAIRDRIGDTIPLVGYRLPHRCGIVDGLLNRVNSQISGTDLSRQLFCNRCFSGSRQAAEDDQRR